MKKRILIIEDDPSIGLGLRLNLEKEGYEVTLATDGQRGLDLTREVHPALIILDLMLPNRNGFEILHELRAEQNSVTPIIVLSARTAEMDKVASLELGAEDFVAKPFSLAELLARVRGTLKRAERENVPSSSTHSTDVEIEIDVERRLVRLRGKLIELTHTEFDVLHCLAKAQGRVLSREEIFRAVWGATHHGTPRTVDNFMQQLRAKLEDDPTDPKRLVTVRGAGYRMVEAHEPQRN
jgi:two-component system, OmpR family, alkaline phosphatase synthesis response regulator PhoP